MPSLSNDLRDKLVSYIEDCYAMENQIAQTLQRHAEQAAAHPDIQAKINQHLAETEMQRKRMQDRLEAYGKEPGAIKGAISNLMGNVIGAVSAARPETLAMNMRDEYVTEHFEIASYTLLIATARACGDDETIRVAELNLREEIAMQEWLAERLSGAAIWSLEDSGVELPANARNMVETGARLRVTFEPTTGQPAGKTRV